MTDWYEQNIEPEIRPLVRLLRDNGFNTECSCGHDMYVQIALTHDGELQRLDNLLFNEGYRDYSIMLELRREDGYLNMVTDVKLLKPGKAQGGGDD